MRTPPLTDEFTSRPATARVDYVWAMYFGVVILWGGAWFAISLGLGTVPADLSVCYRFVLSGVLLFAVCLIRRGRIRYSLTEHLWLCLQGTTMFGINYILFYRAIEIVPSGIVAVIYSTIVLMNVFVGALFRNSPIRMRAILGGIFGFIGVFLLFSPERSSMGGGAVGLLMALGGTFASSISQVTAERNLRKGMHLLPSTAYAMLYGGGATFAYCVATGRQLVFDWSTRYVASLGYLVIFASLFGFGLYLALVRRLGADRVAYASVLYPVIALTLSSAFEGFHWSIQMAGGLAVALARNAIILSDKKSAKTTPLQREDEMDHVSKMRPNDAGAPRSFL
jgi:drug/metabolite transporter (DMT)-like permease